MNSEYKKKLKVGIVFQVSIVLFFSVFLLSEFGLGSDLANWIFVATTLLGILMAMTHKLTYRRDVSKVDSNKIFIAFMFCFLVAVLIRYIPLLLYQYSVMPGGDQYFHALMANLIIKHGSVDAPFVLTAHGLTTVSQEYTPAFHVLSAILSQIMHIESLDLYLVLAPSIMAASMLAIYFFAKESFGNEVALFSSFIYGFLSYSPVATLWDGGYPNLIGANFLLIIGLAFYVKMFESKKTVDSILAGSFFAGTVLTHMLSGVYVILIVAISSLVFLVLDVIRHKGSSNVKPLTIMTAIVVFGFILTWRYYVNQFIGPIWLVLTGQASASIAAGGKQTPLNLNIYPEYIGDIPVYFGILGTVFLISRLRSSREERNSSLLLLWLLVIFVFSRTSSAFVPIRFTRDLAAPLSVSAGLFVSQMLPWNFPFSQNPLREEKKSAKNRGCRILSQLIALLLIGILLLVSFSAFEFAVQRNKMVLLNPEIYEAIEWLQKQENGTVLASPLMELPVMVISGHQSITPGAQPKDFLYRLEERSREVAKEAWYILDHPDDPDTFLLLRKYEISYLFLLKKTPYYWGSTDSVFVDYELFKESSYYEVVYENLETIILTPNNNRIEESLSS